jgi:hypothetical protein
MAVGLKYLKPEMYSKIDKIQFHLTVNTLNFHYHDQ